MFLLIPNMSLYVVLKRLVEITVPQLPLPKVRLRKNVLSIGRGTSISEDSGVPVGALLHPQILTTERLHVQPHAQNSRALKTLQEKKITSFTPPQQ